MPPKMSMAIDLLFTQSQCGVIELIGFIWMLINSASRAGRIPFRPPFLPHPLPPHSFPQKNTALCTPTLNYSCPTYSWQIIQHLHQFYILLHHTRLQQHIRKYSEIWIFDYHGLSHVILWLLLVGEKFRPSRFSLAEALLLGAGEAYAGCPLSLFNLFHA
jgi:hypothetical protein